MIKLIIDSRENQVLNKIITPEYSSLFEKYVIIRRKLLECGDYMIVNVPTTYKILIERKTVSDLLSSIKDGRYYTQMENMKKLNSAGIVNDIYYIIENNTTFGESIDVNNYINHILFKHGIKVCKTDSLHDTVETLASITKLFKKRIEMSTTGGTSSIIKHSPPPRTELDINKIIFIQMLTCIPTVSPSVAYGIVKYYNGKLTTLINDCRKNGVPFRNIAKNIELQTILPNGKIKITTKHTVRRIQSKIIENIIDYFQKN